MSVESITKDTVKGAAIRELQGLKQQVVAGANINTNIALAGSLVKKTTIVGILIFDPAGPTITEGDLTEAAITSDGNLQLDTTDTTGLTLIVTTFNKA